MATIETHAAQVPTRPSEVTAETPLEALNLNWREQDLPERERTRHVHRLHPYLGKYIPQLVEVFLRKYLRPGQVVCDPFCGSGTTLVQANELGIGSEGYDISAFNVLLSRAKTAHYDLAVLEAELAAVLDAATEPADISGASEWLRTWYAPQALGELLAYRAAIEGGDWRYKDLLRVILSRAARSARLARHFDLDFPSEPQTGPYWCHKHRRECYPTQEALKFLRRYTADSLRRVAEFAALRTAAPVAVHHADSREADFAPCDAVMTSPPYVGLIDYHEQHRYAYELLGLEDRAANEIGSSAAGTSSAAKERYQQAVAHVLARVAQVMPPGAPVIVVAADTANLYPGIAQRAGLEPEGTVQRHVNRRTGLRTGDFYETVFVWRVAGGRSRA
jgi:hypothetical protein